MSAPETRSLYTVGDLIVDLGRARVCRDGTEIPLPKLSFELLIALIEAAPNLVTLDALMERVWPGLVVSPETISQRVKLLRSALGDDAKQPRYIAGVRGRGYRLIAQVALESAPPVVTPQPATETNRKHQRRTWHLVGIAAVLLALGIVGVIELGSRRDLSTQANDKAPMANRPSVAVLPFTNLSGSSQNEALALGIAESVLHQLANLREVTAIARTSSFAVADRHADAREIGKQLNARYLLDGSVQSDATRLRVTAQLVDTATSNSIWSMQFNQRPQDIFAVQDDIARQVVNALQLTLDPRTARELMRRGTENFDAYLAFAQGRALLNTLRVADQPRAITHFERAISLDPKFAAAYVALAQAEVLRAEYDAIGDGGTEKFEAALDRGHALVAKAIELDDRDGDAYIQRAHLHAFVDVQAAEADFRRGLELQPNNARGYEGLAAVLYENPTRLDEAQRTLQRARDLDPLEPRHDVTMAVLLFYGRGNVEEAEPLLLAAIRKDPLYEPALSRLGELRWIQGELAEAADYAEQALSLDPHADWTRRYLLRVYLDLGDFDSARRIAQDANQQTSAHLVPLHLYRHEWELAAKAAYAAIETGGVAPMEASLVVCALRMQAHATHDYTRARAVLEKWSGTSWDEHGRPRSGERSGMKEVTIGLADILKRSGEEDRARRLLESVLNDMERERDLGRGDMWHLKTRPLVLALLGQNDAALALLERSVADGFGHHDWWYFLEVEPGYQALRSNPRFQQILAEARANAEAQRERSSPVQRQLRPARTR